MELLGGFPPTGINFDSATQLAKTKTTLPGGFRFVMPYHCRFLNPRLKNLMCKSEFSVLF